jgi:hypothetical protein
MKSLILFLSLAATAGAATTVTDDIIPVAFAKDRYAETKAKSPFVLETKSTEAAAVEKPNPFQGLYLRGISKEAGKDYVLIQRLGEERPMRFIGNEPGPDGMSVKSIVIGNSFRETKIILQLGTDTGDVKFKEDTSPPPPPQGMRQPGTPGQPQKSGGMPMPMPQPQGQSPVRVVQPGAPGQTVPRPGTVPMPQPTAPQPVSIPQIPGAPQSRIRQRPINN